MLEAMRECCPGGYDLKLTSDALSWLARRIIQGRLEDEAAEVLPGLRDRMSRPPPGWRDALVRDRRPA